MQITIEDRSRFHDDGFLILKGSDFGAKLKSLTDAVISNGQYFFDRDFTLGAPIKPTYTDRVGFFYKTLRYLPELFRLAADPAMIDLARQLDLAMPCMMNANNVRIDTPENCALFHWHQDTTYLLGSTNAITVWIPITPADQFHGTIEVVPGSHKFGIFPFKFAAGLPSHKARLSPRDLHLTKKVSGDRVMIDAIPGDIVVFYQLMLHRSTPNTSSHPRITAQLRYSDLSDATFRDAHYPFGDQTNIFHVPQYMTLKSEKM
jgi:hypothetical protein